MLPTLYSHWSFLSLRAFNCPYWTWCIRDNKRGTQENFCENSADKMYTVSKGPSKIVAKTRRGLSHSQNIERLETLRDQTKKPIDSDQEQVISVPKPVFHSVNGKKSNNQRAQQEIISPQHAELISYICESWDKVCKEFEQDPSESSQNSHQCIVYYNDGEPSPVLQDFKPFDLESWWGKRLFNNITKSI